MAVDRDGKVAACAGAAAFLHPDHPKGGEECWWGMLATHPDWRGARLSLRLGAEVMIAVHRDHGFTRFFTGVEPDNATSEAICTHAGLHRTDMSVLTVADPALLPGGRMTK